MQPMKIGCSVLARDYAYVEPTTEAEVNLGVSVAGDDAAFVVLDRPAVERLYDWLGKWLREVAD